MIRIVAVMAALVAGCFVAVGPADAMISPDTRCSSGAVSITFDDGPSKTLTPKLLKVLRANHAQATFFVQGMNARRYPSLLRAEINDGHAVENHTWDHPKLTRLSSVRVSSEISATTAQIRKTIGIRPEFMRPPYGDTDARVERIINQQHLRQELWTIDSEDWRGGSSTTIANAALSGLRKHKSNVILMHDAVTNSPRTIAAVPAIVKGLRKKGYCLVPLQITAPLSYVAARNMSIDEGTSATKNVTVTFVLDTPSQRDAAFGFHSIDGTAVAGQDYNAVRKILVIKRGAKSVSTVLTSDPIRNRTRTKPSV